EPMPAGARPVILFMVDGMRPDWLREAVKRGIVPNIARYFFAQGTELESFTSHSVTLTSWGTILTGVESDRHGLRASSNASRDPSVALDSFLDFRHDLKYLYYGANPESRGLMRIRSTKTRWLPDYVKPSEALTSFQPIRAQQFLPFVGFGKRAHVLAPLAAKGSLNGSKELDLATSADMAAAIDCNETAKDCGVNFDLPPITEEIESQVDSTHRAAALSRPRSSYRLVTVWFSAVDHIGHEAPLELDVGLKAIDKGIGEIMDAAARHSTLKNAVAILTSDHGVSGGSIGDHGVPGAPHVDSEPLRPTDEIFNTTFNLAQFMAGDYTGAHEFPFVVGSHKIDKPFIAGKFDLLYKIMPPFSYTYAGIQKNSAPGTENVQGRSLLVEPYGDSLAHVIFTLDRARNLDPSKRISFHELSRYPGRDGKPVDIPAKLLDYQVNNIVLTQNGIRDDVGTRLKAIHGNRPVGIFAMALEGQGALAWARTLAPADPDDAKGTWRPPVLVRAHGGKSAVILTRDVGKEAFFRYVIVDGFGQISREAPGEPAKFAGTRTTDPSKDPLGYDAALPLGWQTDRQWAAKLRDEWYPTAVFSIARNLTLASDYGMDPETGKPIIFEGEQIIDERGKTFFSKIGSFFRLNELRPKVEKVTKSVRSIAEAEQPDFILYANIGFSFNPFQAHSGDHGGIAREHVKNSLFVYDPDASRKGEALRSIDPVLSKDVAATVLDYLGLDQSAVEGRSFRKLLAAPAR
ncbi:MAG TPA: alkaline phosphatase family protein, partial [Bdellovibrionota bacterium]|nr:alkaline phosphatase family protein [Bdellovibrionota bacterium]